MEIREVDAGTRGRLFLHSMPGRFEEMDAFVSGIRSLEIGNLVCLTSEEEIAEKSPGYLAAIRENRLPCGRTAFPLPDFGTPDDAAAFQALVRSTADRLQNARAGSQERGQSTDEQERPGPSMNNQHSFYCPNFS